MREAGVYEGRQHTLYVLMRDRSRRYQTARRRKKGYRTNTDKDTADSHASKSVHVVGTRHVSTSHSQLSHPTLWLQCTVYDSQGPTQWPDYLAGRATIRQVR